MTYSESAQGQMISKARALVEFKKHGMDYNDFEEYLMEVIADPDTILNEDDNIVTVNASTVMLWLGY